MDNVIDSSISSFDTPYVHVEVKEGILFVTYKKGITITLDIAKDLLQRRLEFTKHVPYPILVSDEGLLSVEKNARDYLSNEGTEGLVAGAFVLKSVYSTFFFNFYLKITNPKIPSRTFTDKVKALEWLEQFKARKAS